MVKENDTLPYVEKMEIVDGDTLSLVACHSFEKIKGQIVNQMDDQCLQQGLWIITDSIGNKSIGNFKNSNFVGIWKHFNPKGKLIKEIETVTAGNDTYTIKEIDYVNGEPKTVVNKPFLAFYLKNLIGIGLIFFVAFFSRVFINSKIYNLENGTNKSPIHFHVGPFVTSNFDHSLLCTFTFWFFKYKSENKKLVIVSNSLSVLSIVIFFGVLVGLKIEGVI